MSYTHRNYAEKTLVLCEALDELGVSCWHDKREIWQGSLIHHAELARRLEDAVRSSRLFVYFRIHERIDGPLFSRSGREVGFNWQMFERQFATQVLHAADMYRPPHLLLGAVGDLHPYIDMPHLAYLIAICCGRYEHLDTFWDEHLEKHSDKDPGQFGNFKWHDLRHSVDLPDIINPATPECRKNTLHPGELEIRQEFKSDNEFVSWENVRHLIDT